MITLNVFIKNEKNSYPYSNRVSGTFTYRNQKYSFDAKIYPEKSSYCINNGNVFKLWVQNTEVHKDVFVWDRGIVIGRTRQIESGMIKGLIEYLTEYAESY